MSEEKIPLSSNSSSGGPENNTSNNVNAPKIEIKGISKNKPIILKGKKKRYRTFTSFSFWDLVLG